MLLIAVLIVISLLFGGFQKGTKSGSLASLTPLCTSCTSSPPALRLGGLNSPLGGLNSPLGGLNS